MRKFPGWLVAFIISFFAFAALAQSAVKITAVDPTTGPAGTVRNVVVDSQGRLIVVGDPTDGGSSTRTPTFPASCRDMRDLTTVLTPGVVSSVSTTGLQWLRVCNSLRNVGSPLVTCATDTNTPTTSASSIGVVLAPGDCLTTPANPFGLKCISDEAIAVNYTRCYL